jgi:hypothetical protein
MSGGAPPPAFATSLQSLRARWRELMRAQSDRLVNLESRLEQQFADACQRIEQQPREIGDCEQELFDKVETLEREIRRLTQLRRESEQALDEARTMLGELEKERRILRERLDEVETRGATGQGGAAGDPEEVDRLNRRLEMAMNEVRELKAKNTELAEQSKRTPSAAPAGAIAGANQFDWETQKRRLLEQLNSSFDDKDNNEAQEKIKCQDVIRETERYMAEKGKEIEDLYRQLMDRPESSGEDGALAEAVLDADEVIRNERQRLASMQDEWQEKLRHAEVEISIERAKLARERLHLEDKLRTVTPANSGEPTNTSGSEAKPAKSANKWLARLGLGGEKDKDG